MYPCNAGFWLLSCDFENVPEAVVMETAHCGEVRGESFALTCLKLLDEELYVGGDHFFGRLGFGGRGKGSDIAGFVRGGMLLKIWRFPKADPASCARSVHLRITPGFAVTSSLFVRAGSLPIEVRPGLRTFIVES
jgi:hypothetical protein